MSLFGGLVTFIVVWWIVLFTVLPWGIKSQTEADTIVMGSDAGSPKKPNIKMKFLITTLIALIIWGFFMFLFYMDIVSVRDFL